MVEEDSVDRIQVVGVTVVNRLVEGKDLGAGVGALGAEGRGFPLGGFDDVAEHFAAARLIDFDLLSLVQLAGGFEDVESSTAGDVEGVNGRVKRDADVALGAEVVNFIGLDIEHEVGDVLAVGQVAVVQEEVGRGVVGIAVNVVDPVGIEAAAAADDAVDVVTFFEQKFGQVGAILAGDTSNDCNLLCHGFHASRSRWVRLSSRYES